MRSPSRRRSLCAVVLCVAALAAAAARAQCVVDIGGSTFDLSQANNGAYVHAHGTHARTRLTCRSRPCRTHTPMSRAHVHVAHAYRDATTSMGTGLTAVVNTCVPITTNTDPTVCPPGATLACQRQLTNNFRRMASFLNVSSSSYDGTCARPQARHTRPCRRSHAHARHACTHPTGDQVQTWSWSRRAATCVPPTITRPAPSSSRSHATRHRSAAAERHALAPGEAGSLR